MENRICNILGIKYPIIQAAMNWMAGLWKSWQWVVTLEQKLKKRNILNMLTR